MCSKTPMKMGALWNLREKAGKRKCWERLEWYWRRTMLTFTNISSINSADTKCISRRETELHIDLWMRRILYVIKLFKTATVLWLFAALLDLLKKKHVLYSCNHSLRKVSLTKFGRKSSYLIQIQLWYLWCQLYLHGDGLNVSCRNGIRSSN